MNIIEALEAINWELVLKILRTFLFVLVLYFVFSFLLGLSKAKILEKVRRKRDRSNVKIFFQSLNYLIFFLLIVFGFLSFIGSISGIGIAAGLLTASLGWALQRPITGMAAWIMLVLKRPFEIGDRIVIGSIKGDVIDISLTHVHIGEIGGTIASEEISGRIILIPNSRLFEENIVNYTLTGEEILDVVRFVITFKSNLSEAEKIAIDSAEKVLANYNIRKEYRPYIREFFDPSGIQIQLRYYTLSTKREEISSKITRAIVEKINDAKDIRFAYHHTEVVLNNSKNKF